MYRNINPYMNPYMQPPMQNQGQVIQTIQKIEEKSPQATCYFVQSAEDFKVDVLPGIYYLGINEKDSELYMRKINDNGNPEFKIFRLAADKKEKTEMQQVVERLTNIEKKLDLMEKENGTIAGN